LHPVLISNKMFIQKGQY